MNYFYVKYLCENLDTITLIQRSLYSFEDNKLNNSLLRDKIMQCSPVFYTDPEVYAKICEYVNPKGHEYERDRIIHAGSADTYKIFISMSPDSQRKFLKDQAGIVIRALFKLLDASSDNLKCKQSILCTLDGIAFDLGP